MERVGSISRRVLARLIAANDNLEWGAGADAAEPSPARACPGRKPVGSEERPRSVKTEGRASRGRSGNGADKGDG
jgi:hypothetical protein